MKKTRIRFSCLAVLMALVLLLPGCGKSDGKEPASSSGAEETVVDDFTSEENLVTMHRALTPVFDGTFRSQMLDEEKMIYDALKQHIIVEKRTDDVVVDFSSVDKEFSESVICLMANGVYWAFMYDYPEAEVSMFTESTAQFEDGKLQTLTIKLREYYENGYAEMDTVRSNIKAAVEEIMSARASDSRYDTVKAIHDYVCKYATYDFASNDEEALIFPVSTDIINVVKYYARNPMQKFAGIALSDDIAESLQRLIRAYMSFHFDIGELKSEELLGEK